MKGSTESRKSHFPIKNKQFWLKSLDYSKTMKDMNFIEINRDNGYGLINMSDLEIDEINDII